MSDEPVRKVFGFERTRCGCAFCTAPCRHSPGSLAVSDLERLCPADQNVFTWAEEHLRAVIDKPYPTLVPVRQVNGHCHWLFEGRCAVHANSPYGCAYFDTHMGPAEVERRSAPTIQARQDDARNNGLYYRVWMHLQRQGLTCPSGDRSSLAVELGLLHRQAQRHRRRQA